MHLVVIDGGHAGIVPTPQGRKADCGSRGQRSLCDRGEASVPGQENKTKGME